MSQTDLDDKEATEEELIARADALGMTVEELEEIEREERVESDRAAGRFPRDVNYYKGYNPLRFAPRPLNANRPLWHRQPTESVQAYEAFMAYLMQPLETRTLRTACETVEKSRSCLMKWYRQWQWKNRVASYEEHFLLMRLDSVEADRDRMWREQQQMAEQAMDAVTARLKDVLTQVTEAGTLSGEVIKMDALVRLMDTAAKIQRLSVMGRAELAEHVKSKNDALQQQWADELAMLFGTFINDLELTPEQQIKAKDIAARLFLDGDDQLAA